MANAYRFVIGVEKDKKDVVSSGQVVNLAAVAVVANALCVVIGANHATAERSVEVLNFLEFLNQILQNRASAPDAAAGQAVVAYGTLATGKDSAIINTAFVSPFDISSLGDDALAVYYGATFMAAGTSTRNVNTAFEHVRDVIREHYIDNTLA